MRRFFAAFAFLLLVSAAVAPAAHASPVRVSAWIFSPTHSATLTLFFPAFPGFLGLDKSADERGSSATETGTHADPDGKESGTHADPDGRPAPNPKSE